MNPFISAKVFADFQGAFYKKPLEAGFGATPQHSTPPIARRVPRYSMLSLPKSVAGGGLSDRYDPKMLTKKRKSDSAFFI